MKRFLIPLALVMAFGAHAQQRGTDQSFETEAARRAKEAAPALEEERANEIRVGNIVYSGILIEALKAENQLQLLNPFAPPEYGSPEDNVVRDPIHSRVIGLKLFSIEF